MSLTIAEKKSSSKGDSGARKERRAECRGFFGGFVVIFALKGCNLSCSAFVALN